MTASHIPGPPAQAIAIPHAVLATIYEHARGAFPDECCGYLVGPRDADRVDGAVPCRNAQRDGDHPTHPERDADTGFVIAGRELLDFARSFESARPARIVYHSHTNGRAYFSTVDRGHGAHACHTTASELTYMHYVTVISGIGMNVGVTTFLPVETLSSPNREIRIWRGNGSHALL
jgi:proteasome lid subunit RPN8/RPN11